MTEHPWLEGSAPETLPIRRMTDQGIEWFRTYLVEAKAGATTLFPEELLLNEDFARVLDVSVTVEAGVFETALDAARYLHPRIQRLSLPGKYYDVGLWSWMAAFYLESVCPANLLGHRKVGELSRYIPPLDRNYYGSNRHLLALPVRMFDKHGDIRIELLFFAPPSEQTLTANLITQSQELSTNPGILDAIHTLYWDASAGKPKRGFGTTGKPGTLRRFLAVMNQFNRTFDLFSLSGEQIIDLLPQKEFGRWLKGGT